MFFTDVIKKKSLNNKKKKCPWVGLLICFAPSADSSVNAGYLHTAPAATVFMKLREKEVSKIIKHSLKTHTLTHTHCISKLYN